jgi:Family of unknown function (DUF6169)
LNAGYKFIKSGKDYEFFTAYGAAYAVSFAQASTYFGTTHPVKDFIHRVDIAQLSSGHYNWQDILTGITVAEIVNDFFETDKRNVLFYICDPKDGRMKARQRKFDYWFRIFNTDCTRIVSDIIPNVFINYSELFRYNADVAAVSRKCGITDAQSV